MAIDTRYLRASDGTGSAVLAHITIPRLAGATVLKVDNVDNWPPFFIATTGKLNPTGYIIEATKKEFRGHLQGADIIIDGFEPGFTDEGNTTDQVVIIKQTTGWADRTQEAIAEIQTNVPRQLSETLGDGITSGGVWTYPGTGFLASMTALVAYIGGVRVTASATTKTLTATKDTYVLLSDAGAISYTEVTVGATAPTAPADSIIIALLRTDGTKVTTYAPIKRGVVKAANTDFGGDYSTTEVDTGFKWIDGKTIYKKTVSTGALPNNSTKTVSHGISGIDSVVSISSVAKSSGNWIMIESGNGGYIYLSASDIIITTSIVRSDFSGFVTICYTKV